MATKLKIQKRDPAVKPDDLRTDGIMPAVYYGKKTASTPIAVDKQAFHRAWREAGESTVVSLESDDGEINTVISDVQVDPVSEAPIHADFYAFEKGQRIEVSVPLEFVGEAPVVKEQGAVLVKVLHEVRVEAEPANLPGHLEVDISVLTDLESQIVVGDIALSEGVELAEDAEDVVASVYEAQEEPEETEEMDISDIEVEGEKEGEGDEGGEESGSESSGAEEKSEE